MNDNVNFTPKEMLVLMAIMLAIICWFSYIDTYRDNKNQTASKGIWFRKTLDLTQYKVVGSKNFTLTCFSGGKYYTRSDRHEEIFVCDK